MKVKITTFIIILLLCSLCFDTAAYAQEPVMNDHVIEDDGTEPSVQELEAAEEEKQTEDTAEENVIQVQITSTGVSQSTGTVSQPVPQSKKLRVLMVGNSLTRCAGNRTVSDLKKMAKKAKRKITVKQLTYNNEKMVNWANPRHKNGKRLYKEIRSGKWDYIVLQEQTDASVKQSFINASKKLAAYIRKTSPKT